MTHVDFWPRLDLKINRPSDRKFQTASDRPNAERLWGLPDHVLLDEGAVAPGHDRTNVPAIFPIKILFWAINVFSGGVVLCLLAVWAAIAWVSLKTRPGKDFLPD